MTTSTDLQNPYASPRGGSENAADQPSTRLPKFVKVVLILDLVACIYRLVNGAACLVGVTVARSFLFDKPDWRGYFRFLWLKPASGFLLGFSELRQIFWALGISQLHFGLASVRPRQVLLS